MISYDLRGHGNSDKSLEPAKYQEKAGADEVQAVINRAKLKRPCCSAGPLAGASSGIISQSMAPLASRVSTTSATCRNPIRASLATCSQCRRPCFLKTSRATSRRRSVSSTTASRSSPTRTISHLHHRENDCMHRDTRFDAALALTRQNAKDRRAGDGTPSPNHATSLGFRGCLITAVG
jgi:hypothetical protein